MPDAKKQCIKCKQLLPLVQFNKDASRTDGRRPYCRQCRGAKSLNPRRSPTGPMTKEKAAAATKASRAKNYANYKAKLYAWRAANPERHKEIGRSFRERNRESLRAENRVRYAQRRTGGGAPQRRKIIEEMLTSQKRRCVSCPADLNNGYHLDHINAVARGGTSERKNLQLLCPTCNLKKGARHPVEFMQSAGFLL